MFWIQFHGLVTIQENARHSDSTALALLRQTQQWGWKTSSMLSHPASPSWSLIAMSCLRSKAVRKPVWVERMKAASSTVSMEATYDASCSVQNWISKEVTFYRYLLLKNNFLAKVHCEHISLFLIAICFPLILLGKILKTDQDFHGIFLRPCVMSVLSIETSTGWSCCHPEGTSGYGSHSDPRAIPLYLVMLLAAGSTVVNSKMILGEHFSMRCLGAALAFPFSWTVGWKASCILCSGWERKWSSCCICGWRPMQSTLASPAMLWQPDSAGEPAPWGER